MSETEDPKARGIMLKNLRQEHQATVEQTQQLLKDHGGHLGPCLTAIASEHTH